MKQLILCRHGKSSWTNPDLKDFDRPLNRRGLRDAPRMGKRLAARLREQRFKIVSSRALRALTTARIFAGEFGISEDDIVVLDQLYHADEETLLSVIEQFKNKWDRVVLVGHNPGLSDLAVTLTTESLRGMPTCGMVTARFDVDSWGDVRAGIGELEWLDSPKRPGEL